MATSMEIQAAYSAVLRDELNTSVAQAVATSINNGSLTFEAYVSGLVDQAANSTVPAVAVLSFFEGEVPSSARIDAVSGFAQTQFASYAAMGSVNPALGPYEAIGAALGSEAGFQTAYGSDAIASNADFVSTVYLQVFGTTPSAGAAANLNSQVEYFVSLYTSAGIDAETAMMTARGAVYGQIIGYAFQDGSPSSPLASQVENFFQLAATGDQSVYEAPLPAASPEIGDTIALTAGLDNLVGTSGNDTFVGDEETFNNGDVINGLAGSDTLRLFLNTDAEDSNFDDGDDNVTIRSTSVENIEVDVSGSGIGGTDGAEVEGLGLSFDLGSAAGVKSVASVGSENDVTFDSVQNNVTVGLSDSEADLTVNFDNDALGGEGGEEGGSEGATVAVKVANVGSDADGSETDGTATFSNIALNSDGDDDIGTIDLEVTGRDQSYLTLSSDGDVSDLTIRGEGRLIMAGGDGSILSDVETIDASANTGGVSLDLTGNTENLSFTGGSGNDLVVFDADSGDFQEDDASDRVDGGAGQDVLVMDVNDADDIRGPGNTGGEGGENDFNVTNFEILGLTGTSTGDVSIDLEDGGFTSVALLNGVDVTLENSDDIDIFVATDEQVTLDFEASDSVTIRVDRPEALEDVPDGFGGITTSEDGIAANVAADLDGIDSATFWTGENEDSLTADVTLGNDTDTLTFAGAGDVAITLADADGTDDEDNLDTIDLSELTGAFSNLGSGQTGEQRIIVGDLDNPESTAPGGGTTTGVIPAVFNFDDEDGEEAPDLASIIDLGGIGGGGGTTTPDEDSDRVEFTSDFNSNIAIVNFNSSNSGGTDSGQFDFLDFTGLGVDEIGDLRLETINGEDTLITSDLFEGRVLIVGVTGLSSDDFDFVA